MITRTARLTFMIPYAHSLKDKRQVYRSLTDKARSKFNAAIAEVATQDRHQTLTLGIAVVSGEASHAGDMLEEIIRYLETHTDAELVNVERGE